MTNIYAHIIQIIQTLRKLHVFRPCAALASWLAIVAWATTLPAQPPAPAEVVGGLPSWTLEQLEQTALENNPTREQAIARLDALRGKWVQTGLWPNPTVGYSGQQLGSRGLQEQNGVIVEQSLIRGGKLRLNREIVEIGRAHV